MITPRPILLAFAAFASATLHAQLVSIDFSNGSVPSGAAAIGSPGDVWNGLPQGDNLAGGSYSGFVDSTGAPVAGLSLAFGSLSPSDSYGSYPGDGGLAGSPLFDQYRSFFDNATGSITFTLSGLTAASYDVYLYAQGDSFTNGTNTMTIGLASDAMNTSHTTASLTAGVNYASILGVVPTAGTLAIQLSGSGNYVVANGLQIQAVPEPSTWAALAGAGALLLALRRRRS
jgi:hypothetical protein